MQDFPLAFGRVTRSTIAANPELRTHVSDLIARAYMNLHAAPFHTADQQWASSITGAALQLSFDSRVQAMSVRELIQLFETIIVISEEHLRESRRHAAMATNAFYLKETSLDAMLSGSFRAANTTVIGENKALTGRVDIKKPDDALLS